MAKLLWTFSIENEFSVVFICDTSLTPIRPRIRIKFETFCTWTLKRMEIKYPFYKLCVVFLNTFFYSLRYSKLQYVCYCTLLYVTVRYCTLLYVTLLTKFFAHDGLVTCFKRLWKFSGRPTHWDTSVRKMKKKRKKIVASKCQKKFESKTNFNVKFMRFCLEIASSFADCTLSSFIRKVCTNFLFQTKENLFSQKFKRIEKFSEIWKLLIFKNLIEYFICILWYAHKFFLYKIQNLHIHFISI